MNSRKGASLLSWFKRGNPRRSPGGQRDLDASLLHWSKDDAWTIRDACGGGCIAFGATGSGKTSGFDAWAEAILEAGFGGLVLTVKNERALWERYCRHVGRLDDLLIFGADEPLRFNFLDYELNRKGRGRGFTENVVQMLSTVSEVLDRGSGNDGREEGTYWHRGGLQLSRCAVDVLALATGHVTAADLTRLVLSAPTSLEQLRSEDWRRSSDCFRWIQKAERRDKTPQQQADFALDADYWLAEFPTMPDKTRGSHVSGFTSMLDILNRSPVRELLCGETNITPEAIESGKIILIDMPLLEFGEAGLAIQSIWKYAFQRSIERRNVTLSPLPVFLWVDEAQHFVTSHDMSFLTTCRASRVATVMLTQNVSNFYAALGGNEKGRAEADSLFANFNTKVFFANGDPVTNEWAASVIGRTRQFLINGNSSMSGDDEWAATLGLDLGGRSRNTSAGFSETYEYDVQPAAFTQLRTGGPANGLMIDAIVFQNGKTFKATGRSWLPVTFKQRGANT